MTAPTPMVEPLTDLVRFATLEDLLSGQSGTVMPDPELINALFETGRNLILAPPGAGKSVTLNRLGHSTPTVDKLMRSVPAVLATELDADDPQSFRRWLLNIARRPRATKLLLCLDGLDEIQPTQAQAVLDAVEEVTRKDPQLAIVLTDRVTRRAIDLDRWGLFGVLPRGESSMRAWGAFPFFRAEGIEADSRSDGIRQRIERAAPSVTDDLGSVAGKAYMWLAHEGSTAAPKEHVRELLGDELTGRLRDADLLRTTDRASLFAHPLYHAYLAASHLRDRSDEWSDETWDAITVDGASYAALGLLLEQVQDADVDRLVRAVDRWNYLAAASLLAEDLIGTERIPSDLRSALLLLLGHRRFSPNLNTALLAADMLRLQAGDQLAALILEAANRQELSRIASELPIVSEWWRAWIALFSSDNAELLVQHLSDEDYLLAWTASNVLSSFDQGQWAIDELLRLAFTSQSDDVRWRALHALGSSSDPRIPDRCLDAFRAEDEHEWVRYGALRVYLQVVALVTDAETRRELCVKLASAVDLIRGVSRWEREIERAAELADAPADWADTFGLVIAALWTGAGSLEEEDRWRAAAAALQTDQPQPFPAALRPVLDEDQV